MSKRHFKENEINAMQDSKKSFKGIVYSRKVKTAPACDIDCESKTHNDSTKPKK